MQGFGKDLLIGMILIDLQKTFGRIYHNILLIKSPLTGFFNRSLDGFSFTSEIIELINAEMKKVR